MPDFTGSAITRASDHVKITGLTGFQVQAIKTIAGEHVTVLAIGKTFVTLAGTRESVLAGLEAGLVDLKIMAAVTHTRGGYVQALHGPIRKVRSGRVHQHFGPRA